MSKVKYYYDSDTLSYRKVERKKGRTIGFVLLFITASVLMGLILLIAISNSGIDTPKERRLERENANLVLQLSILESKMDLASNVLENIQDRDNEIYRILLDANPIPNEVRKAGFGGINRYENLKGYDNSAMIIESHKRMDQITKQLDIQSKSLDEIARLSADKEKLLAAIPAIQPVSNEDLTRMASGFGYRTDPFTKARKKHWGMDFTAPRGTPVYASGDGTVSRADATASGYGKHIRITHGYGYESLYAHLNAYNVRKGQKVKRGDLIGFVGSTGRSEAPHLHYEIFKEGERINPIHFYYGKLSPAEFDELLKQSQQENQSLD
ncbi:peptidase M23 [Dokdonia pacifica]|uniref:Peptidase family M23 n=1 Tax=Dokdonia pacifica TaxID=1627892 RepID=A0A238VPV4_9FLAO|nr:M23 family metallopeptidase [Dokdonia pacifica]GGG19172.1 peptidase M23 [Dokdonia pacifica]SNR36256.1 Peptidase family M23 [Dokdonia pacifica]